MLQDPPADRGEVLLLVLSSDYRRLLLMVAPSQDRKESLIMRTRD